jgi:phospholipid transport system substrate-binding protein
VTANSDTESPARYVTLPRDGLKQLHPVGREVPLDFGRFSRLLRQRRLIADGVPVKLGTRAFDPLSVLLEADGSLVTKEELLSRVWPGTHVSEDNPRVQIVALRRALGEERDIVGTDRGRGYRFAAAVKSAAPWRASRRAARPSLPPRQRTMSRWMATPSFPECSHRSAGLSALPKSSVCKALAFALGLGLSTFSYAAHAAPASGIGTVQGLYDALLSTMKNGRALGGGGCFAQLAPVIRNSFDVALMARLSVGPVWTRLNEEQRQELTESYARYTSAIYADRFHSYHGQKLEVIGEQSALFGLLVKTRIIKSNGEPVEVDYLMRRSGESWLISDIYLDGTISEVATRRSEFATILETQGIDGLIAALNRKADALTGTTARSS